MKKSSIWHIIECTIALAACVYLGWKIATYDAYPALWSALSGMTWVQYAAIILSLVLMPVNMSLEAWRWQTLMPSLSFREAQLQVYYSKLAGLITPWRLGEYPARGVLMAKRQEPSVKSQDIWSQTLSMGAVGSATMTAAIVLAGVAAMMISNFRFQTLDVRFSYLISLVVIMVLLGLGLYFAPRLLKRYAVVTHQLVAKSLGQSFLRLLCWCVQLGLILWALDAFHTPYTNLFIYYLFVTVTPNVPIAEVGVRGAWAIVLFGSMNAALAGVLLWIINTLLPCLVWPFIKAIRPKP